MGLIALRPMIVNLSIKMHIRRNEDYVLLIIFPPFPIVSRTDSE